MLLLINNDKIEEELKKTPRAYTASGYCEPVATISVEVPTAEAHSAINVLPPDVEAARERLMALRQKVIERGGEVASGDALARIIDETRGR